MKRDRRLRGAGLELAVVDALRGVVLAQAADPLHERRVRREQVLDALAAERMDDVERRDGRVDLQWHGLHALLQRLERLGQRLAGAEDARAGRVGEELALP